MFINENARKIINLMRDGRIWVYNIIPILIGIVLEFIILILLIIFIVDSIKDTNFHDIKSIGEAILKVISSLGVGFLTLNFFYIIVLTIGAPFQDLISERIEELSTGKKSNVSIPRSIYIGVKVGIGFLVLGITTLIINLLFSILPVVGNAASLIVTLIIGGYGVALGVLAMTFGRKGLGFRKLITYSTRHLKDVLLLGICMQAASFIPLLNIIILPLFIVWGSLLAIEITNKEG